MTVTVEKKRATLGDLPDIHPDVEHLPISVLTSNILGEDQPDLDAAALAAQQVYENWPDDEWRNAFIMALHSYIENQVHHHRHELQRLLDQSGKNVIKKARRQILKSYINDVLLETVEKAEGQERIRPYVRRTGVRVGGYTRAAREAAENVGQSGHIYGTRMGPLTREQQRAEGARMAAQLANAYGRSVGQPDNPVYKQSREVHILRANGNVDRVVIGRNDELRLGQGDVPLTVRGMGVDNPVTLGQNAFNVAQALGTPPTGAQRVGAVGYHLQNAVGAQGQQWGERLKSMANVLHYATKGANPQVEVAVAMGKAVGQHGPEVSKVLGGHMRRHRYRYRGVQADPSQWTATARAGRQPDSKGKPEDIDRFQRKLALSLAATTAKGGLQAVPYDKEARTMLKAGGTPPSHGFLLNSKGEVKQQAHGYADDHYVPFNLRDLHHLNGGSYVRSRSYGGPTTEDFSLAMRTGAKGFTIISRQGIYDVNFTPRTNKAGTKVGAWARDTASDANQVMVKRYGKLLDAVANGAIDDPATGHKTKLDGPGYAVALESLRKQFPYFIQDVKYTPANDVGDILEGLRGPTEEDQGYVRPYFLRPTEAYKGYHDPLLRRGSEATTFDDDQTYRLGLARRILAERETQRGGTGRGDNRPPSSGVVGGAGPTPRGTPGGPPTSVTRVSPGSGAMFMSGAGEFGQSQSEVERRKGVLDDNDLGTYLKNLHAVLDHADVTGHTEAQKLRAALRGEEEPNDSYAYKEYLDAVDAIRNDPSYRDNIRDMLEEIAPQQGTGLEAFREFKGMTLRSIGEEAPEDHTEGPENDPDVGDDYPEYLEYKKYRTLRSTRDAQLKTNPDFQFKKPETRDRVSFFETPDEDRNGMTPAADWEVVTEDTDGLPYWQWYENELHARFPDHPDKVWSYHEPPEPEEGSSPDPSSSRTAVHEEDTEEDKDRKAEEYASHMLRGLGDRDIYG